MVFKNHGIPFTPVARNNDIESDSDYDDDIVEDIIR